MSEIKHTPGPWRLGTWSGQCHKESHQGISHPGPRGVDPCVYTPYLMGGLYGIAADNGQMVVSIEYDELVVSEADANLIAAAPELLEAAQTALSALESIANEMTVGDRFTNAGQLLLDALEPCRSAIAKARSQS